MIFNTPEHYISKYGTRKFGIVEYIRRNIKAGLGDREIQAKMIKEGIVPSAQMLDIYWRHFKSVKGNLKWNI